MGTNPCNSQGSDSGLGACRRHRRRLLPQGDGKTAPGLEAGVPDLHVSRRPGGTDATPGAIVSSPCRRQRHFPNAAKSKLPGWTDGRAGGRAVSGLDRRALGSPRSSAANRGHPAPSQSQRDTATSGPTAATGLRACTAGEQPSFCESLTPARGQGVTGGGVPGCVVLGPGVPAPHLRPTTQLPTAWCLVFRSE